MKYAQNYKYLYLYYLLLNLDDDFSQKHFICIKRNVSKVVETISDFLWSKLD